MAQPEYPHVYSKGNLWKRIHDQFHESIQSSRPWTWHQLRNCWTNRSRFINKKLFSSSDHQSIAQALATDSRDNNSSNYATSSCFDPGMKDEISSLNSSCDSNCSCKDHHSAADDCSTSSMVEDQLLNVSEADSTANFSLKDSNAQMIPFKKRKFEFFNGRKEPNRGKGCHRNNSSVSTSTDQNVPRKVTSTSRLVAPDTWYIEAHID